MKAGRIHSLQSLGAVDGPGLRYVVFLQGCPLRCVYCHNPDTWAFGGGQELTADELTAKIIRFKGYFGKEGGVTVSGGEPLWQAEFVTELFQKLHQQGIHTALDTSCVRVDAAAQELLCHTDLVLADLKFTTPEDYRRYTGGDYHTVRHFLDRTREMGVPVWIRHVVVPGLNDTVESMCEVQEIAQSYPNLQKIEWLPFQNLCQEKYDSMGIPFPLEATQPMAQERLDALVQELNRRSAPKPE